MSLPRLELRHLPSTGKRFLLKVVGPKLQFIHVPPISWPDDSKDKYNMIDYHPDAKSLVQHSPANDANSARRCS